jgi:hypothetical protein
MVKSSLFLNKHFIILNNHILNKVNIIVKTKAAPIAALPPESGGAGKSADNAKGKEKEYKVRAPKPLVKKKGRKSAAEVAKARISQKIDLNSLTVGRNFGFCNLVGKNAHIKVLKIALNWDSAQEKPCNYGSCKFEYTGHVNPENDVFVGKSASDHLIRFVGPTGFEKLMSLWENSKTSLISVLYLLN